MPINPHNIARPVRMTAKTYVPPKGRRVKVGDNDTWVTLAAGAHTTAWALIRYNYPSLSADVPTATREVNWYLESYVGCTLLDREKRNYRFSSVDNPGFVWLPVPGAAETADEAVRKIVLDVLRGPGISSLNFGVGRYFIGSSNYEEVADAIERGYIRVHADPALHNKAQYFPGTDHHIDVAPGMTDFALIVHECTHAIFDIHAYHSVVAESEGIAYIAQVLYILARWGSFSHDEPFNLADPIGFVTWKEIWDEAGRLATMLQTTHYVTAEDAKVLFWAINHNNWYQSRVGSVDGYNGMDPAFY